MNLLSKRYSLPEDVFMSPSDSLMQKYLLEVGCGVGNTIFPLLEQVPGLFVYGVDFSARAIQLVKVCVFTSLI